MSQRDIKFRAFFEGKMVPVNILHFPQMYANSPEVKGNLGIAPIMQFTGLTDKNGKDVYESDIVKTEIGIGKVVFEHGCFLIEWIDDKEAMVDILSADMKRHNRPRVFEVIGNSHENKNLL